MLFSDGSPLVRAELAVALARFAFGHNRNLKSIAAAYWKPQPNSVLSSFPLQLGIQLVVTTLLPSILKSVRCRGLVVTANLLHETRGFPPAARLLHLV
ncbi:putative regulatory associated protein of TOR [Helianthus annuus]|nr:putative regulatory associated protein of TOR [Helianthus annuus]